jgi:prephenate dehydratase
LKCPDNILKQKTSIVIGLRDRPGALYELLEHFARAGVNLTKIESRPTKKSLGDYIFYIDFTGDAADEKIKKILDNVKKHTTTFKVLGSYSRQLT